MIIRSNNSNLLGVFSKLCCTVLYDFEGSLEGLPIYILRNCQFPSQNWSLKRNDGIYRMLVSSMKFTCSLHNIRMPRSSECRTSKRLAVKDYCERYFAYTIAHYTSCVPCSFDNSCFQSCNRPRARNRTIWVANYGKYHHRFLPLFRQFWPCWFSTNTSGVELRRKHSKCEGSLEFT